MRSVQNIVWYRQPKESVVHCVLTPAPALGYTCNLICIIAIISRARKFNLLLFSLSVRLKTVSQLLTRQDKVCSRRSTILCLTWMKAWCASTEQRLIHKTRREPLSLLSTSPRLLSRYVRYSFDVYSTLLLSSRSPSITPQRALNWPRRTVVSAMHKSEFSAIFKAETSCIPFLLSDVRQQ